MEILKSIVGDGQVVTTHASEVLIRDDYVYKIKKPVDFGFLDYGSLKKRRAFCILENELNTRYAENIYLGVYKIVQQSDGFALVDITSSLPAVEYVVKMRRIPEHMFLHTQVSNGAVDTQKMRTIGSRVAEMLMSSEPAKTFPEDMGINEQIRFNALDNFAHIKKVAPELVDERFKYIERITTGFLDEFKELFEERVKGGFVKNGHGDLRLEHVYLDKEKIGFIDCIEFNREFRMNDVVSEAAFLSMELDYNGLIDLSDSFIAGFLSFLNDPDAMKVLNYYRAYRAMVRAKVAVLTSLGVANDDPLRDVKIAEYHRMLDMAVIYSFSMVNVKAIVFCGMIASGKSTNAELFVKRFPVCYCNTDIIRKSIAGIAPLDSGVTDLWQGFYSVDNSVKVYERLGQLAASAAQSGRVFLADGTFILEQYREAFERYAPESVYVVFTAPDDIIKKRLEQRENVAGVTDGRLHHFEGLKKYTGQLPDGLVIDTSKPTDLDTVLRYLYGSYA